MAHRCPPSTLPPRHAAPNNGALLGLLSLLTALCFIPCPRLPWPRPEGTSNATRPPIPPKISPLRSMELRHKTTPPPSGLIAAAIDLPRDSSPPPIIGSHSGSPRCREVWLWGGQRLCISRPLRMQGCGGHNRDSDLGRRRRKTGGPDSLGRPASPQPRRIHTAVVCCPEAAQGGLSGGGSKLSGSQPPRIHFQRVAGGRRFVGEPGEEKVKTKR